MPNFEREELLKVAKLSALSLNDNEIHLYTEQLQKVLDFIEEIKQVPVSAQVEQVKNINIFREDDVTPSDPSAILKLAPKQQENYFVVPKILNEK